MAEELGPLWVFYEEEWLGRVVSRGEESGVVSSSTFRDPTNGLKWSVQVTWGLGTNRKYDEDILCDDVRPMLLNRFVNDPKLVHRKVLKLQSANWADASFAEDIRLTTDATLKRMDAAPRNRVYPDNGPAAGLALPQRPVVLPQNQGLMRLVQAAGPRAVPGSPRAAPGSPRAAPGSPSQAPAGSSHPGDARGSKRARADHEEAGGLSTLAEAAAAVRSPVHSPAKGGGAGAGRATSGASRGAGAKGANPPAAKRQASEQAVAKKQAAKTKASTAAAAKAAANNKGTEPATPATSADSDRAAASSESFQSLESAGREPDYKDMSEWVKGWTGTYYPKSVLQRPADLPVGTAEGDDDEEYEIETLVDEFKDKKETYVLVKWVGWACDPGKGRKQVINGGKGKGHWMPLKQWAKEQEGVLDLYNEWRKDKPEWYRRQMV